MHCAVFVLVVLHFSRRRWSLTMWNFDIKSGIQPGRKRLTVFYIPDVASLDISAEHYMLFNLISDGFVADFYAGILFTFAYFIITTTTTTTFI